MAEETIGKYEVLETVGKGAMGVVYKAQDPEIGRIVAIKTLKSLYLGEDAAGQEAMQRFRQESRSAGKLHHPNIVTIFEAGRSQDGSPYIVMSYIEGASLEKIIADRAPLEPAEVIHYLAQTASAIDYAHRQNVIHRDIKPSNVIIDTNYQPHLLDFGVAKMGDSSLTPAGTVVGTPSYMSPEQIRGETLDGRADVFSFAVVAYEMFTKVRPFPGRDFTTVVTNIIHKAPLSFADAGVKLPAELEKVLGKGLSKDREGRYGSAFDLVQDAARALSLSIDGSGLLGGYRPGLSYDGTKTVAAQVAPPQASPSATATPPPQRPAADKPVAQVSPPSVAASHISPVKVYGFILVVFVLIGFVIVRYFHYQEAVELAEQNQKMVEELAKKQQGVMDQANVALHEALTKAEQQRSKVLEVVPSTVPVTTLPPSTTLSPTTTTLPAIDVEKLSVEQVATFSDEQLVEVLRSFASHPGVSAELIARTVMTAGKRENPNFLPLLTELVNHSDYMVRVAVLKEISRPSYKQTEQAFQTVVRSLDDSDILVRGFAVRALANYKRPEVESMLQQRLSRETNEVVLKVLRDSIDRLKAVP